jgi:hypothetical protein
MAGCQAGGVVGVCSPRCCCDPTAPFVSLIAQLPSCLTMTASWRVADCTSFIVGHLSAVQEQFMSSAATDAPAQASAPTGSDAVPYSDQYAAYSPYPEPNVKPSVAHV